MRLYGTPPSHFTRKVRILLQELGVPFEFVVLDKLMETGPEKFANNPLHMFPVLEIDGRQLIESDLICDYIIDKYSTKADFSPVSSLSVEDRQRLALINGGMSAGVTLIRSKRSGIEPWTDYAYFRQELAALDAVFSWLDKDLGDRASYHPGRFTLLDIALVCLLDWAVFREFLKDLPRYQGLERFLRAHEGRASVKSTHPSIAGVKA